MSPPYPRPFSTYWLGCPSTLIALSDAPENSLREEAVMMFNSTQNFAEVYLDENGNIIRDIDAVNLVDFDFEGSSQDSGAPSTQITPVSLCIIVCFTLILLRHLTV